VSKSLESPLVVTSRVGGVPSSQWIIDSQIPWIRFREIHANSKGESCEKAPSRQVIKENKLEILTRTQHPVRRITFPGNQKSQLTFSASKKNQGRPGTYARAVCMEGKYKSSFRSCLLLVIGDKVGVPIRLRIHLFPLNQRLNPSIHRHLIRIRRVLKSSAVSALMPQRQWKFPLASCNL